MLPKTGRLPRSSPKQNMQYGRCCSEGVFHLHSHVSLSSPLFASPLSLFSSCLLFISLSLPPSYLLLPPTLFSVVHQMKYHINEPGGIGMPGAEGTVIESG
jgi:hypothetical protein